jgi:hypothetical protein
MSKPRIKIINHRGRTHDAPAGKWWQKASEIGKKVDQMLAGLEDEINEEEGYGTEADKIMDRCRSIVRAQV